MEKIPIFCGVSNSGPDQEAGKHFISMNQITDLELAWGGGENEKLYPWVALSEGGVENVRNK